MILIYQYVFNFYVIGIFRKRCFISFNVGFLSLLIYFLLMPTKKPFFAFVLFLLRIKEAAKLHSLNAILIIIITFTKIVCRQFSYYYYNILIIIVHH